MIHHRKSWKLCYLQSVRIYSFLSQKRSGVSWPEDTLSTSRCNKLRIYLEHKTQSGAVFRTYLQSYGQESQYCEPCTASSLSAWEDRLGGQVRRPPVGVRQPPIGVWCEAPQHCSIESMQVPCPWEMSTDVYFQWVLEEKCSGYLEKQKPSIFFLS